MPQLQKAPGGIRNEAGAQRVRGAAQLLVHARKDLLLAGLVPGDLDAAIGLKERLIEQDEAARIVLAHHQVKHGVIQGPVRIVLAIGGIEIAKQARALIGLVSGHRVLALNRGEDRLGGVNRGAGEREVFDCDALRFGQRAVIANQPDDVRPRRWRIPRRRLLREVIAQHVGFISAVVG